LQKQPNITALYKNMHKSQLREFSHIILLPALGMHHYWYLQI
jgi:hypothetical protein